MRLAPDRSELWQVLRLVLSCTLAWGFGTLVGLKEIYWALITAVVVTKPLLPQTIDKGRDRIVGTLIGGAIGFLVLVLSTYGLPRIPLFCVAFVTTALIVARVPAWQLAGITLIVVVLIPSDASSFWRPFDRVAEIVIGVAASAVVAFVTRPRYIRAVLPTVAPEDDKDQDDRVTAKR